MSGQIVILIDQTNGPLLVLKSANGTMYKVLVDDSGNISTTVYTE